MEWSKPLIKYWCEHYYQLRDYELNPFERVRVFGEEEFISGSEPHLAPYEETCDLNWEFDKALKKLSDEKTFRAIYLDGELPIKPKLFKEFCKLLEDENVETE